MQSKFIVRLEDWDEIIIICNSLLFYDGVYYFISDEHGIVDQYPAEEVRMITEILVRYNRAARDT